MKVLLVEDDPSIVEIVTLGLGYEQAEVSVATDGLQAVAMHREEMPDIVVLDIMLPKLDGLKVLQRIRAQRDTPVILLTARDGLEDRVAGLDAGADDYLTKPFNPRELVARVKAVLRRAESGAGRGQVLTIGDLSIDLARREVAVGGTAVSLRTKEFDLLAALARDLGVVFSRERLLESVWGYEFDGETRTVDVHVNHLREKLAGSTAAIETIRGIGYKLAATDPARA